MSGGRAGGGLPVAGLCCFRGPLLALGPDRRVKGRSYYRSAVVIVDEVGYTPIAREDCVLFYRFVAARYGKASTILTSNEAFSAGNQEREEEGN